MNSAVAMLPLEAKITDAVHAVIYDAHGMVFAKLAANEKAFARAEFIAGACNLHDDLVAELLAALPFVEDLENDSGYKPGAVKKRIASIRAALAKAGAI